MSELSGFLGFVRVLRAAGVAADASRGRTFVAALAELDVTSAVQVYWPGRLTLCSQADDLPRWDAAFSAWFTGTIPRPAAHGAQVERPSIAASLTATAPPSGDGEEHERLSTAASNVECCGTKTSAT